MTIDPLWSISPPQKSCELNAELHVPGFAWSPWETVPVAEILQLRRKVGVLSFLWKASIIRSCELVPRSYLNEPAQVVTQSFQLRYISMVYFNILDNSVVNERSVSAGPSIKCNLASSTALSSAFS